MDTTDLHEILTGLRSLGNDHLSCEVKKARGGLPATLWESVSAFSNGTGGIIILGVDEKNGFSVTGVDDPGAMEAQLGSICSEMEPPVRAEIVTLDVGGKSVVVCTVPPMARDQRPCHKRSLGPWAGSRIRIADGDRKLTDYEVTILLGGRHEVRHDLTPIVRASRDDLDPELVDLFLRRIRDTKTDIFRRVDDDRALSLLNVLTTHEGRTVPTLAGLLAFGVYPQTFEPQLNLTFVAYPTTEAGVSGGSGERFVENRSIDGPIPFVVAETIRVLKRNMRRRSVVSGIYRVDQWEYPEEALREAVVNALVHRDYSEFARGMQVQVEMYPDRLLIRNPGGLYGPVDVDSLGSITVTSSRNRTLLKILEDMPYEDGHMVCENRGTGIARMFVALSEAGMEPPRFADDISTFTAEFPNHTLLDDEALSWLASLGVGPLSRAQMTALALMRQGAVLTNSSYRTSTGVQDSRTAGRELKELVDREAIQQIGTGGVTTYRLAVSSRTQQTALELGDDASLSGNETAILRLLENEELSRAEIERRTGLPNHQVVHALRTLRAKGRIVLRGKPRSKTSQWAAVR